MATARWVGYQQLVDAVRSTGAQNIVIAGGLDYAFDLSGVKGHGLQGDNIAFSTHVYNFSEKQPHAWPRAFGELMKSAPVICTEFGDTRASLHPACLCRC